jgi:hypothetical protein
MTTFPSRTFLHANPYIHAHTHTRTHARTYACTVTPTPILLHLRVHPFPTFDPPRLCTHRRNHSPSGCPMLSHPLLHAQSPTATPPTVVRSSRPINHFEDPSTPSSPVLAVPPEDAKQAKPMSLWHELLGCLSSPLFIAVSFGCAPCPTIAQASLDRIQKKHADLMAGGHHLERVFNRV